MDETKAVLKYAEKQEGIMIKTNLRRMYKIIYKKIYPLYNNHPNARHATLIIIKNNYKEFEADVMLD